MPPSAPFEQDPGGRETGDRSRALGDAVDAIVRRLHRDPERRAGVLGEAFIACEELTRERPDDYRAALQSGQLESFLEPAVRASGSLESSSRPSGGWLGTFIGADARPTASNAGEAWSGLDSHALETSQRALRRAQSIARADGNRTLLRNLTWYRARLAHQSYDAIAASEGRPKATIRTGVARARKFVLRVVNELEQAQPAPLSGAAPPELEPLRVLWERQDVERLRRALERTRDRFGQDPHWLNLAALAAHDAGDRAEARRTYQRALVFADAPSVRARVLNNLGNLEEDEGRLATARVCWKRATQILPTAPAPILNLLADAAAEQSYAGAQHYIATLGELLRSGRLTAEEETYVLRRLEENPKLGWLRSTDAWRGGPARWLARERSGPARGARPLAVAFLIALAVLLGVAWGSGVTRPVAGQAAPEARAAEAPVLVAGDSMGKSDRPRPRRPIRRVRL